MSKPKPDGTKPRPIPLGSCTWCGHEPHDGKACTRSIRTATSETDPCPCARRNR